MPGEPCGLCVKPTSIRGTPIRCCQCNKRFHVKCAKINSNQFTDLSTRGIEWLCNECYESTFPLASLNTDEIYDFFNKSSDESPTPNKSTKCDSCSKKFRKNALFSYCQTCSKFNHLRCVDLNKNRLPLADDWMCIKCCTQSLPYSSITNDDFLLTMHGFDENSAELLKDVPSFSIQTLLDQLPGQKFDTDEFVSDSIESKYYTPAKFISKKLPKKSFTMIHLNIASLQRHIDELRSLLTLLNHPFDVICITETRLHQASPLVNIEIPGYDFHHTPTLSQCGGAGIYVKSTHEYEILNKYSASHFNISESIFIEIKSKSKKNLIIGCIYRHHTPISDFCTAFLDNTLKKITKSKKTCALLGDFNIDLIKYGSQTDVSNFYDQISTHGFRPLILQPTRLTSSSATLIDNIFINDLSCSSKGGNITTAISDHLIQFSQIDLFDYFQNKKTHYKSVRNWRIFNKREFADELGKMNWDELSDPNIDTDTCFTKFYNKTTKLLDEMAPYKKNTKKEAGLQQNPWITKGILISMNKRDVFYKDFITEKNATKKGRIGALYKTYRNLIVTLIRKSKKKYYADFFHEHQHNLKKTWDGIRDLINVSKKSSINISKLIHEDRTITDNKTITQTMNNFFVKIGPSIEKKIPNSKTPFHSYLNEQNANNLALNPCTTEEITTIISKFGSGKASGPFSIPTNLLKEFSLQFSEPLKIIINKSLLEGSFPQPLKTAVVCPIYKKNEKTNCANYRPISLLSNVSKVFERIMYNRIEQFLNESDIIYEYQFGFRKKYSTNHALLSIVEQIRNNLDNKQFACGVFVDLQKAFDTVNHKILLSKLKHYGINGFANKWLSSYLTNRTQSVSLNGITSDEMNVSCGVPQGSILGPLLFTIYINDMHNAFKKCLVHHFADDTNLLYSDKDPRNLQKVMDKELKVLVEWLRANRLSLNVDKTEFIIFRPPRKSLNNRIVLNLDHNKIYESTKIKYLGLLLDSRLSWKFHINELSKKLSRTIGMLYKIRAYSPKPILRSLYFGLFHSHLTYGLPVWGNAEKRLLDKIALLQKKALRAITFADYNAHTCPIMKESKILSLADQTQLQISSLMWDLDHDILPPTLSSYFKKRNLIHQYNTRTAGDGKFHIKKTNTKRYGHNSFQVQGSLILNNLKDLDIYKNACSKKSFLNKLKNQLLEKY